MTVFALQTVYYWKPNPSHYHSKRSYPYESFLFLREHQPTAPELIPVAAPSLVCLASTRTWSDRLPSVGVGSKSKAHTINDKTRGKRD